MSAPRIFVALLFLAVSAHAQQPSPRPAYDGSGAPDVARQIHVDGNCRIVPDLAHPLPHQKTHPFHDSNICHLESTNNSEHMEERISGTQLQRAWVRVSEQTFVLQNITNDHIVFVVEVSLPNGWTVDSDPQPNRYDGQVAVFPVHAQPGEIVQLHVGMRHVSPLKAKTISAH